MCTIKSNLEYIDQINHKFITVCPFCSYLKGTKHFFFLFGLDFSQSCELSDLRIIWTSQLKWDFQIRSAYAKEKEGIDRLIPSHRDRHWVGIRNPLNSAIANNEPSLLKLQRVLIGFKVMKKTTRSIIIKWRCRHVRASGPGAATGGAGLRLQGAGPWPWPCPWGSHPSTNSSVWAAAAPECSPLILKRRYIPATPARWWCSCFHQKVAAPWRQRALNPDSLSIQMLTFVCLFSHNFHPSWNLKGAE